MGTVPTPASPGAGTVLTSTQTASWYNTQQFLLQPPACRVYSTAATTLTAGVQTVIPFAGETFDIVMSVDTEQHSTSTNTSRVTIRTAGRYDVFAEIFVPGTSAINAVFFKNGVQYSGLPQGGSGSDRSVTIVDSIQCSVGDYLEVAVTATATSALSTSWPVIFYVKWASI